MRNKPPLALSSPPSPPPWRAQLERLLADESQRLADARREIAALHLSRAADATDTAGLRERERNAAAETLAELTSLREVSAFGRPGKK